MSIPGQRGGVASLTMWALLVVLAGCAGGRQQKMVAGFGTFEVAEDLELRVGTKGMSLVEYELRTVPAGRKLIADGLGRDGGPWFLYWDDSDRLWVHSRDHGTFVWVASRSGKYHRNSVMTGSPFLDTLPPQVEARLPRSAKRSLGIAQAAD